MSVIHINQISTRLKEYFEKYIDISDLNDRGEELENKVLTRCLAAYAIYIVNDCSYEVASVSTIGKFSLTQDYNKLKDAKVNIKVISVKDAPEIFGEEVPKTNNRQNRVENRDFVSKDPEQIRLRSELAFESIEYSIMRSESFKVSNKSFDLNEATAVLACAKNIT